MLKRKTFALSFIIYFYTTLLSFAAVTPPSDKFRYPFYVGLLGGYGSTTWNGLVPENQNAATTLSTPTNVSEGGFTWGLFAGYEFIPQFALEAAYMRYQPAKLYFDPMSIFTFDYDGLTELITKTETASLMGKIMLIIPHTTIRAYSSVGVAMVHRYDEIKNIWRARPTFGAGFNYNFTEHWMGEIGINYVAGYGQAELDPTKDYVPFLYSAFLQIAYRF
jgi:hypothetical protein